MTQTVGQKVYYPGRGPYLVSDVVLYRSGCAMAMGLVSRLGNCPAHFLRRNLAQSHDNLSVVCHDARLGSFEELLRADGGEYDEFETTGNFT
jgi:hypothetical protein